MRKYFLFLLLVPIVILSQLIILEPHLNYGFSDVDVGFLTSYRQIKQLYPNLIENFWATFKKWGVYAHQSYYIGFQWEFFGLDILSYQDFRPYQIITHVFKTLATLAVFPFVLIISGSSLVAAITVILFAFSYGAVGTMYTIVTSSDYIGVLSMAIFLWVYALMIKGNKSDWWWLGLMGVLFALTLYLSTERMYPLIPFVLVTEIFLIWRNRSKVSIVNGLKRLSLLLSPIIIGLIIHPNLAFHFILGDTASLISSLLAGEGFRLLYPFISLGSLILPNHYWRYFGTLKIDTFADYLDFFISGPIIIFTVSTIVIAFIISQKPIRFFLWAIMPTIVFGLLTYILGSQFGGKLDKEFLVPGLLGGYLISLALAAFIEWLKRPDRLLLGLFIAPFFALLYIILTWAAQNIYLLPVGAHRYLTVPAFGVSLFWGFLLTLMFRRLYYANTFTRVISFLPYLLIIPIMLIGTSEIRDFFNGQLNNGFGATDKGMMRVQLYNQLSSFPTDKPSLFSFDFNEDRDNGYYYDNTILASFKQWMLWTDKINFNDGIAPDSLWNKPEILPSIIAEKDGKKGFLYNEKFYEPEYFYAFKLKNKQVIDVTKETLTSLGF